MLLKDIPGKLEDDGIFLASGIIKERQADIEAAAKEVGMQVDHVDEKGGWVVMQMSKVK
jgi:ribosomal protein L11 methyltransferase